MQKICFFGILAIFMAGSLACTKLKVSQNLNFKSSGIQFYGNDYGHDLKTFEQTSDKGFVFGGSVISNPESNGQGFIQKTDQYGRVVWYNTYGGAYDDRFNAVHQTSDGGYIGAGYTTSLGGGITRGDYYSDACLVKTDPSGKIIWEKPFSAFGGLYNDEFYEVAETPGHEFVAVGYTSLPTGGNEVFVQKVDKNGNKLWSRTLVDNTWRSYGLSVAFGPSGEIAVASYSVASNYSEDQGKYYPVFTYLDSSGNILVPGIIYKNLGTESQYNLHEYIVSRADGFIFASNLGIFYNGSYIQGPDVMLFKVDFAGIVLWKQELHGLKSASLASCNNNSAGGLLLSGATYDADGKNYGWLLKTDDAGNILWQSTIPLEGNHSFVAGAVMTGKIISLGLQMTTTSTKHSDFFGFTSVDQHGKIIEK